MTTTEQTQQIGILTTTFYKDPSDLRLHLACQMVGNAVAAKHGVMVVDGSRTDEPSGFLMEGALAEFPRTTVFLQETDNMGGSRREVFRRALEPQYWRIMRMPPPRIFLWTEPEKTDIIRHLPMMMVPILADEADIVIPSRTDVSFMSYPAPQAASEKAANAVFAEVTGCQFDVMAGPVLFHGKFLQLFSDCFPQRLGASDTYIQQIAVMEAMAKRGARVTSVPIDFFYPAAQRHEEETVLAAAMLEKRKRQFEELTTGFRLAAQALELPRQPR